MCVWGFGCYGLFLGDESKVQMGIGLFDIILFLILYVLHIICQQDFKTKYFLLDVSCKVPEIHHCSKDFEHLQTNNKLSSDELYLSHTQLYRV